MRVNEDDYSVLEDTAETVVSYMENTHDISIGIPDFLGSYQKIGVGMQYRPPEESSANNRDAMDDREERRQQYGAIKVVSEPWTAFGRLTDVAHELGHAALYQNADFSALKDDSSVDETVCNGISEAAAYDVERQVKRHHLKANATSPTTIGGSILPYTLTKARYRLEDSFENQEEPHALGRRILHEHGPVLKDATEDVRQLYDDVMAELDGQQPAATLSSPSSGAPSDD